MSDYWRNRELIKKFTKCLGTGTINIDIPEQKVLIDIIQNENELGKIGLNEALLILTKLATPTIVSSVKYFCDRNRGLRWDMLIETAQTQVFIAAKNYNLNLDTPFVSYAQKWILGALSDEVWKALMQYSGITRHQLQLAVYLDKLVFGCPEGTRRDKINSFAVERDLSESDIKLLESIIQLISNSKNNHDENEEEKDNKIGQYDEYNIELRKDIDCLITGSFKPGSSVSYTKQTKKRTNKPKNETLSSEEKEEIAKLANDFHPENVNEELLYVAGIFPRRPYDLAIITLRRCFGETVAHLKDRSKNVNDGSYKKPSSNVKLKAICKLLEDNLKEKLPTNTLDDSSAFGGANLSSKLFWNIGGVRTVCGLTEKYFAMANDIFPVDANGQVYWTNLDLAAYQNTLSLSARSEEHRLFICFLKEWCPAGDNTQRLSNEKLWDILFLNDYNKGKFSHFLNDDPNTTFHPALFRDPLEIAWKLMCLELGIKDEQVLIERLNSDVLTTEGIERVNELAYELIKVSPNKDTILPRLDGLNSCRSTLCFLTYACSLGTGVGEEATRNYCTKRFGVANPITGEFFHRQNESKTLKNCSDLSVIHGNVIALKNSNGYNIIPSYVGQYITSQKEDGEKSFLFQDVSEVELHPTNSDGSAYNVRIKRGNNRNKLYLYSDAAFDGQLKLSMGGNYISLFEPKPEGKGLECIEGELVLLTANYPAALVAFYGGRITVISMAKVKLNRRIIVAGLHDSSTKEATFESRSDLGIVPFNEPMLSSKGNGTINENYHVLLIPCNEISRLDNTPEERNEKNHYGQCIIEWTASQGWIIEQVSESLSVTVILRSAETGEPKYIPVFRGEKTQLLNGDMLLFLPLGFDENNERVFPDNINSIEDLKKSNSQHSDCKYAHNHFQGCCCIQWGYSITPA